MVDILNDLKLDVASLGNHEFDFGVDTLYLGDPEVPFRFHDPDSQFTIGKQ